MDGTHKQRIWMPIIIKKVRQNIWESNVIAQAIYYCEFPHSVHQIHYSHCLIHVLCNICGLVLRGVAVFSKVRFYLKPLHSDLEQDDPHNGLWGKQYETTPLISSEGGKKVNRPVTCVRAQNTSISLSCGVFKVCMLNNNRKSSYWFLKWMIIGSVPLA